MNRNRKQSTKATYKRRPSVYVTPPPLRRGLPPNFVGGSFSQGDDVSPSVHQQPETAGDSGGGETAAAAAYRRQTLRRKSSVIPPSTSAAAAIGLKGLKTSTLNTQPGRTIFVGDSNPSQQNINVAFPEKYPDNRVVTSKYTAWNFVAKNLFEQFRRAANFYFLCVAIIQLFIESPVSPLTSVAPLCFVVGVTAIKQAYEDWLRHKGDSEVNNRPTFIVKQGQICEVRSMDLTVGDVVLVQNDEGFPCDLVLLSSSQPDGECYVTTVNLDGETNLKMLCCPPETRGYQTPESLSNLKGVIECEGPTADLYKFVGRVSLNSTSTSPGAVSPLGPESLLLRGARLKNTDYVYGCAVYTGQETKMALNSKLTSNKFSTIERTMNIYLIIFLIVLLLEVIATTICHYYLTTEMHSWWYLPPNGKSGASEIFQTALSYLVLFNYIIPISMYVTIEMQKFFGSMFFAWDLDLYDPATDNCAKCNTSDLNEELGQVDYLFTDKTGTLTENEMRFRQCSISGRRYVDHDGQLCSVPESTIDHPVPLTDYNDEVELFLLALVLCHTVQNNSMPEHNGVQNGHSGSYTSVEYQASSPDEKALVEACYRFGIVFVGITDSIFKVNFRGKIRLFRRLHVFEFSSDRKCMSVVVQEIGGVQGAIYMFSKGAESSMLNKCISGPVSDTLKHVNDYAVFGLRTLVIAFKKLSQEDLEKMDCTLQEARISLTGREEAVERAYTNLEMHLHLLGAVGVEDRLQEGVPETLEKLRIAGIKVWILTGDKLETAVNISMSCGHFKRGMTQLKLTNQKSTNECHRTLDSLLRSVDCEPMQSYGLVIDGISLAYALQEVNRQKLVEVSIQCTAVVCCRMSPLQKSEVVRLIKTKDPRKPITAAVGDGANDCSMIQEAHVGLGIMGKEGRQAVRCSDFAFSRFKFLQKVFLVHGHYYYVRVATLVQYSFYKNIAFITPQVYFVFFSGYSGQTLYDGSYLTLYNIFFSSLPILIFGMFEQNIKPDVLLENPVLYRNNACNARLSAKEFVKWNVSGIWHSITCFFVAYFMFWDTTSSSSEGHSFGIGDFGMIIFHLVVMLVNLRILLESRFITWVFMGSVLFSFAILVGFTLLYSGILWPALGNFLTFWVYYDDLSLASIWLAFLLVVVMGLVPDFMFIVIRNSLSQVSRLWMQPMELHSSWWRDSGRVKSPRNGPPQPVVVIPAETTPLRLVQSFPPMQQQQQQHNERRLRQKQQLNSSSAATSSGSRGSYCSTDSSVVVDPRLFRNGLGDRGFASLKTTSKWTASSPFRLWHSSV